MQTLLWLWWRPCVLKESQGLNIRPMSTKIRLNISQRRSYSALKLQQVGAIYIWGLHSDHHSVVKGKKKKGSTSQMSSIKATFSSLVFSFHVIFSLFSCPRVVLKRAESGMQGICLQRKTREKNIIFFFFFETSVTSDGWSYGAAATFLWNIIFKDLFFI